MSVLSCAMAYLIFIDFFLVQGLYLEFVSVFGHIDFRFDLFDLLKLLYNDPVGTDSAVKDVLNLRRERVNILLASLFREVFADMHLYWVNMRFLIVIE